MARARAGRLADPPAELAEVTKSDPTDPIHRYNFARAYALASAKDATKRDDYARRAVEQLKEAVKAGYKNAALMAKDSDLAPLRDRDDFKKLLADLEAKFLP